MKKEIVKPTTMKSTEVQNPRRILHRVAYYANARARKMTTPHGLAERVVLSVLAPTRASCISRHRFGQGWTLLTIAGYPLALRCLSSGESRPRVSLKISILAFSLMFRGITLERSRFRQIPTNFLTFVAR